MGASGTIAKGYVIYGPFPFSLRAGGSMAGKNRPALVLARLSEGDLIACQITSKEHPANRFDLALADSDFARGRLNRDSYSSTD